MATRVYRYAPQALAASFAELSTNAKLRDGYLQGTLAGSVVDNPPPPSSSPAENDDNSIVVAAVQLTGSGLTDSTVLGYCQRAEQAIHQAVTEHQADLVLLPELWSGPYFCQTQEACLQSLAQPIDNNSNNILLQRMQHLARQYQVVLPVSLYERSNNTLFNSIVMVDSDGTHLGAYRKSHIPDGPGYSEKFYFSPGDSVGMGVFDVTLSRTKSKLRIGVAICWDQWFPETARCLALQGCELLLYPTAIGSEPQDPTLESSAHWQRVMMGHAAANMVPVVASNRFGTEVLLHENKKDEKQRIHFYGKSFITDHTGAIVAQAADNYDNQSDSSEPVTPVTIISSTIHPKQQRDERLAWGLFRDRRPDLYQPLLTKDGKVG